MWKCPNCHEEVDEHFDLCWNCGSDGLGIVTAEFAPEDLIVNEPVQGSNRQNTTYRFSILAIIGLMTLISVAFQVVSFGRETFLLGLLVFACPIAVFFYLLGFKDGPLDPLFRDWRGGSDSKPQSPQESDAIVFHHSNEPHSIGKREPN